MGTAECVCWRAGPTECSVVGGKSVPADSPFAAQCSALLLGKGTLHEAW